MVDELDHKGLRWQVDVWDRMSGIYLDEIDKRFEGIIEHLLARADLKAGQQVLDLGTGTGSVALRAAGLVRPNGAVTGVDISPEMLAQAERRASQLRVTNVSFHEGRAEAIPAADASCDVVLASLSLMYVIDRAAAAREIARVLKNGGRFVAAVWAGRDKCDIVKLQQLVGSFAPAPPVTGVAPWALADPAPFVKQLGDAGVRTNVDTEVTGFDFADFESAWDALASVAAANLSGEQEREARAALHAAMWPNGDGPRHFSNLTHFICGEKS